MKYKIPFAYNESYENITFERTENGKFLSLTLYFNTLTNRWYIDVLDENYNYLFRGLKVWYDPNGIGGVLLQKKLSCIIKLYGTGVVNRDFFNNNANYCLILEEI